MLGGIIAASLLLLTVTGVAPSADSVACTGCNVILVSVDPLRQDHLGVYGYDRETTPSIDRLAEDAYIFDNAFTHSTHTMPATFTTFTSLHPLQHGVDMTNSRTAGFSSNFTMLTEVFARNGYRTYAVTGGMNVDDVHGLGRGFDRYTAMHRQQGKVDAVRTLLDRGEQDAPFFLYLQTFWTHDPYFVPRDYDGRFGPVNESFTRWAQQHWRMLGERYASWSNLTGGEDGTDERHEQRFLAMREAYIDRIRAGNNTRTAITGFDARVRDVDRVVNRTVQLLERRGLIEDTIIIITAQHGEEFGEHGKWTHLQFYNEVMQVPLIMRVPGMDGMRIKEYVGLVDLAPTILDLAGVEDDGFEQQREGASLHPLLAGSDIDRTVIVADRSTPTWGALIDRDTGLKYLSGRGFSTDRVYNLTADPDEKHPVQDEAVRATMRDRFERAMAALTGGAMDDGVGVWPYFG